jgi:autotransporter-associated beta strand protein
MNTPARFIVPLAASIALLLAPAKGAEIAKLQNNTALNLAGAWNGALPGAGDVMLWNSLYTTPGAATTLSLLGGDMSVLGLKVTNVGGAVNAANTMVGFQNTSSANTLTIGANGIDLSAATQALMLQSKITIGASQNWVINNANTNANPATFGNNEDLVFQAQSGSTTAASTAFNLGGNTVTTSGNGQAMISSGYAITNGTINVGNNLFIIAGGTSRLVTVGGDVNLNVASGATLQYQSNSAAVTSSAAITLNGGTLKLVSNNATNLVTINGSVNVAASSALVVGNNVGGGSVAVTTAGAGLMLNANLTGSGNLTVTNNASTANMLILAGNNSGYSGTITFGGTAGRVARFTSASAGSANATWSVGTGVVLQTNGVAVSLGTLTGTGTVNNATGAGTISVGAGNFTGTLTDGTGTLALTKVGSGTLTLGGVTSNYTGATTVSQGTLLVSPGALSGTAVTVSSGATYAAQSATSGTVNTNVSVSAGGTLLVRPLSAGATITMPTVSTAATGTITFDTGVLGNPTAAPLAVTTFTPIAGTKLKFLGSGLSAGTFAALNYTGSLGGAGFGGLSLVLPFRVTGNLVDNAGVSVGVNITGTAKPAWNGNVNANWNIDTVGDGSTGTANWVASTGPNTYVEAGVGTDSVIFDDTASGSPNVNLTTTLTPGGVSVANSTLAYSFGGTGRITGGAAFTKSGTGAITIKNTGTNDYSGGTFINDGTVTLGDGVTSGAGTLGTATVAVTAPGTLEFNRPDDFTFANVITGNGSLKKSASNTATLSGATAAGAVNLAAGTLRFTGGGNLSGAITGTGALTVAGGTLQISGTDANTYSGLTTVSAGTLQLNKPAGIDAVGGNILITGTGVLAPLQASQIPDTATITYNKTGTNQGNVTIGNETFAALTIVNGNDTGSQVLANNGFVVTGLVTAQGSGVFSIASGHAASAGGLSVSGSATVRIAGNSGNSSLSVGALGITASGGLIQVGQGTGAFDAVLNLGGDLTTTGNLSITDGAFLGASLRQLNIGATTRTFNIGAGTTTTIAPDIAGTGGITKTGNGTLQLTAASNSNYSGATTVSAGTFLTTPSHAGGSVSVAGAATLGVTLASVATTFVSTDLTTAAGSTLRLATGALGNPLTPVINTGTFTVDGATTIQLTGTALTSGTGIPLISYATFGGLSGFSGLSVTLPTRMAGTLVDNVGASRVDIDLSVEQAKWNGNVNGNWDIDTDGTGGTGTTNWLTTVSNTGTRYFQGPPITTDTANFDDSATGTTNVTLTTGLTPIATIVNNSTLTYTFAGAGTLTGATSLTKTGTGTLILKNSAAYTNTGGTTINNGTLQVGDGVTPGLGILPTTAVTNNATIALNRPDDFAVTTVINGLGTIVKQNTNTATFTLPTTSSAEFHADAGTLLFSAAANLSGPLVSNGGVLQTMAGGTLSGPVTINGGGQVLLSAGGTVSGNVTLNSGKLKFSNGGTLSGAMTGAGEFEAAGGTVVMSGGLANTNTGMTTISGGTLQLNRPGVNSVAGDMTISGGGVLAILTTEQIADTATINFIGTSVDATAGSTALETVANVICNPSVGTGQFQLRNGFTVTGTATLNNGVLGVSSGSTSTVNALNMTGGLFRIAGNTASSTMNIGAGGITASGGEIQVKFNTNNFDAVVNLGGDFTATGNVNITNGGYTGASLNVINLTGTRTFNIAASTTTNVAADIGGAGGLTKSGNGTLNLLSSSAGSYGGATTISAGTLAIAGGFSIPDTSAVSLANVAGATLQLNANETIGSLSGGGATGGEVALGGNTLSVGDATNTTFSGTISGATGTLIKQGTGTLTLGGTQTYGTLTTLNGTTNVNSAIGTGSSTVNANASTNIGASQTLAALNIGAGAVVTFGDGPFAFGFGDGAQPSLAVVPEPGSMGLLLVGVVGLAARRRRS